MINKLRSSLYKAARLLGDVNAVRRGPKAIIKRKARKFGYKKFARIMNKWVK